MARQGYAGPVSSGRLKRCAAPVVSADSSEASRWTRIVRPDRRWRSGARSRGRTARRPTAAPGRRPTRSGQGEAGRVSLAEHGKRSKLSFPREHLARPARAPRREAGSQRSPPSIPASVGERRPGRGSVRGDQCAPERSRGHRLRTGRRREHHPTRRRRRRTGAAHGTLRCIRRRKKGKQWYFGMKAHIGVDAGSGLAHS